MAVDKKMERMLILGNKVRDNEASDSDKEEYMRLMYENKSISKKNYDDYLNGVRAGDLMQMALLIGGVVFATYAIAELLKRK